MINWIIRCDLYLCSFPFPASTMLVSVSGNHDVGLPFPTSTSTHDVFFEETFPKILTRAPNQFDLILFVLITITININNIND